MNKIENLTNTSLTRFQNLAYAEMRLFLAKFIWTFDFELEEKSSRWMDECKVMVIWQKPELLVRLKQVQRA